ncbi:MAG: hypothetical protein Q9208_004765 [Pyrenodesmia sp. 3 TL-2023]
MLSTSLLLSSLLPLAISSPIIPRQDFNYTPPLKFGIIAARSTSPIHLQPINANGNTFWIGKETKTYCPRIPNLICPPANETQPTVFAVSEGGAGPGAGLNTLVPGGQRIYVSPTGALSFTTAHSAFIPPGSTIETFKATPGIPYNATTTGSGGAIGRFTFVGWGATTGFLACPVNRDGTGPYQVFADVDGLSDEDVPGGCVDECLGFDALTAAYTAENAVWQYV